MAAQQSEGNGGVPRLATVGSCPICDARNSQTLFQSPDHLCGIPGEFTYRRCCSCRTVFQDPRVIGQDIPLCYPDGYYTHASEDADTGRQDEPRALERRLGSFRDRLREAIAHGVREPSRRVWHSRPGTALARIRGLRERAFFGLLDELIPRRAGVVRALEVGCGAGRLMVTLARAGWSVEGLELDPAAAGIARRTSGARVTVGDLLTADLPETTFHLVVLSHVFEHICDPHAALRRIASLLTPGGEAVLIYPNPEGLGARLFGTLWAGWDPPRHLVIPPGAAVGLAAARSGLRVTSNRTLSRVYGGPSLRITNMRETALPKLVSWLSIDTFIKGISIPLRWLGAHAGEEVILVLTKPER